MKAGHRHESVAALGGVSGGSSLEAAHWSKLGAANAPDAEIMDYARVNGLIVITHDLDFSAMLAAGRDRKPSVAQLRTQDVSPDVIGKKVIAGLRQMRAELEQGALLTIDLQRTRLRILPLRAEGWSDLVRTLVNNPL